MAGDSGDRRRLLAVFLGHVRLRAPDAISAGRVVRLAAGQGREFIVAFPGLTLLLCGGPPDEELAKEVSSQSRHVINKMKGLLEK
jgi:hypothetical protein